MFKNIDEKRNIIEKTIMVNIEKTLAKLCFGMIRFDSMQRSMVAKVKRVLESKIAEANMLILYIIDRESQVDWGSSRLSGGDEQPLERLKDCMRMLEAHN